MKIAHFAKILSTCLKSNILRVGGSESSVINLARAQNKNHDVIILNSKKFQRDTGIIVKSWNKQIKEMKKFYIDKQLLVLKKLNSS